MRKGQSEILGLVMIVLLVSVGLLFVVGFLALRQASDVRQVFVDKQLAITMNDALLSSSTTCRDLSVQRLIIDCAQGAGIFCGQSLDSCDYVSKTIDGVLNDTLAQWGKEYRYTITGENSIPYVSISNGPCSGELEPGIFPLQTSVGTIFVRLDICE